MARTQLAQGTRTTTSSTYNTDAFMPAAGQLVLAFVATTGNGGAPAGTPTAVGNGFTWVKLASVELAGLPDRRLTCFRAMGTTPLAGVLTFDFGGVLQALCTWSIFQYDNTDQTGTDGSGAVGQADTGLGTGTSLKVPLGPLADAAASTVVGGIIVASSTTISAGAGLTQIDQQPFAKGGNVGTLQTEDRLGGGQTVDWNWTGTAAAAAIAAEVKAGIIVSPRRQMIPRLWHDGLSRFCFFTQMNVSFHAMPSVTLSNALCGKPKLRST